MEQMKRRFVGLLRWSERYTKTDMVYLAKGGGWLTGGQFISAISSFLLAIAFANLLPKETYGSYRFLLSAASILSIPTLQGMNLALIQAVARNAKGTVYPVLKTKFSWSLLASLVALFVAGYYFFIVPAIELGISFLIAACLIPFMETFVVYDAILQGQKRFRESSIRNSIGVIVAAITMAVALFFTDSLPILVLAYFIPWTLVRYLFLKETLRAVSKDEPLTPETITYGKHLTLMGILGTVATHLDKVLLFYFLGPAQVAIYSIAIAPLEQIKGFLKNIYVLAFPKFSIQKTEDLSTHIGTKILRFSLFLFILMLGYIVLAPFVLPVLFPAYLESIRLSQWYAVGMMATASLLPLGALQAQGRTKDLYLYNIIVHTSQILLLFLGALWFGIIGVIFARVIGRFIQLLIATVLSIRKT